MSNRTPKTDPAIVKIHRDDLSLLMRMSIDAAKKQMHAKHRDTLQTIVAESYAELSLAQRQKLYTDVSNAFVGDARKEWQPLLEKMREAITNG